MLLHAYFSLAQLSADTALAMTIKALTYKHSVLQNTKNYNIPRATIQTLSCNIQQLLYAIKILNYYILFQEYAK